MRWRVPSRCFFLACTKIWLSKTHDLLLLPRLFFLLLAVRLFYSQTAWWYQRFLLDFAISSPRRPPVCQDERWQAHLDNLRELVQDEGNSKWAWLGLLQVMERLGGGGDSQQQDERREILNRLMAIDPDRKGRYIQIVKSIDAVTPRRNTQE